MTMFKFEVGQQVTIAWPDPFPAESGLIIGRRDDDVDGEVYEVLPEHGSAYRYMRESFLLLRESD